MAIAATSLTLYDGARNTAMQFTGIGDGNGDETNVVKVRALDLVPIPKSLKIMKVTYDVSGGLLQLLWAADAPVPFANLSAFNALDYTSIGGLVNQGGDTANGDILISTLGFDAGSSYTVTLEMVKKFP